jgi:pimeloyl-ACP methyl ester carboxylesterase
MELSYIIKTVDGFNISAVHTTSKRSRIILWLHGITVDKNEYLGFFRDGAKYLAEKGYDSLRVDFRGHGESSGTSMHFSITGQMLDVDAAMGFLFKHYNLAGISLNIVACSFGAPPAIFAAARYSDIVKTIILISPVISYKRTFLKPETEWGASIFNEKAIAEIPRTKQLLLDENFPVSIRLMEEMKIIQPELSIRQLTQPIVIIHGDADSMVPYNVSKEISKEIPNITFFSMPGMDHGFMDESDETGTNEKSIENKVRLFEIISEYCN